MEFGFRIGSALAEAGFTTLEAADGTEGLAKLRQVRPAAVFLDLDMPAGKAWLYRPGSDQGKHGTHKTAYRGHQRVIAIGPRSVRERGPTRYQLSQWAIASRGARRPGLKSVPFV